MKIELIDIKKLSFDKNNSRKHNSKNLDAIKSSISTFGVVEPLVVRKSNNVVIGGNGRLSALREMGFKEVPVHYVDVDDNQAKAMGLALNRTAELAEWDMVQLPETLKILFEDGINLEALGFSQSDLAEAIEEDKPKSDPKTKTCPHCGEIL